jgi:hypothetical protein
MLMATTCASNDQSYAGGGDVLSISIGKERAAVSAAGRGPCASS